MARVKKRTSSRQKRDSGRLRKDYERIKADLRGLGYVAQGTIAVRWFTCGKLTCRCAGDPKQRHGPYYHWTRKIAGKTQSRILPTSVLPLVRQAIRNHRHLEQVIDKMRDLSVSAFEAARIHSNP